MLTPVTLVVLAYGETPSGQPRLEALNHCLPGMLLKSNKPSNHTDYNDLLVFLINYCPKLYISAPVQYLNCTFCIRDTHRERPM